MIKLDKSGWWQDVSPRGKKNVNMATVIPREPDSRELAAIGEWLERNGKIPTNNPYNVTKFALTSLRGAFRKMLK